MDRRQFISVLVGAASAGAARTAHAENAPGDIEYVAFVRDLYTRQVEMRKSDTHMSDAEFYPLFSREVRTLMQAPKADAGKEPDGPILNTFFGWGVLPRLEVTLDAVAPAFGGAGRVPLVRVDIVFRGEKRQIMVRPVWEDDAWRIADIAYGSGPGLVAYLRRITGRGGRG